MAHLTEDLAVTLEKDRPGTLAQAIGCVSAAGLNIDGYSEMNGVVHVLTTDLKAARQCLHDAGFRIVQEQHVVLVSVERRTSRKLNSGVIVLFAAASSGPARVMKDGETSSDAGAPVNVSPTANMLAPESASAIVHVVLVTLTSGRPVVLRISPP